MTWVLSFLGVSALYLGGKKLKIGWAVGFLSQVLWVVYALTTHQYAFIVAAVAYGWVYARNWLLWNHKPPS